MISGRAKVKVLDVKEIKTQIKEDDSKIALVIGATGGIGKETCLRLARDGFDIAVHYNSNLDLAQEIKIDIENYGRKAILVTCNIDNVSSIKNMVDIIIRKFNKITALINCSTLNVENIKFESLSWDDFQKHINLNVKSFFFLVKEIIPYMKKNKHGKIINFTSHYIENPKPDLLHYIVSKSSVVGFTKSIAIELAPYGINVNLISPGMTDTNLIANVPEKIILLTEAQTPLRRLASPKDVAGAVSFLASNNSDYLTGETIRVTGGQIMI